MLIMELILNAFNNTIGRNPSWPLAVIGIIILAAAFCVANFIYKHEGFIIDALNFCIRTMNAVYFFFKSITKRLLAKRGMAKRTILKEKLNN